jgi:zinc resistance-associated protein
METTNAKKKIMLAAILTSGLTLAISQAAFAQPDQAAKSAPKDKAAEHSQHQMSTEMQKAREKFLADTMPVRKELAEKNAVMRAIMAAGTPDAAKASQVAGELFELREKLRLKAMEAGMPLPMLLMGVDNDTMSCGSMRHMMK